MGDDRGHRHLDLVLAGGKKAGPFRSANPLVEVAGVPGGAECIDVEWHLSRPMGTVDQDRDVRFDLVDDPLDREDQTGR